MKTMIRNFTGKQEIEIRAHRHDELGATVMLSQQAASMNFQVNLAAVDARLMAAALMAAADDIEGVVASNATVDLVDALQGLTDIIDSAGVWNLSNGVQLGQVSWAAKASDWMAQSKAALIKAQA